MSCIELFPASDEKRPDFACESAVLSHRPAGKRLKSWQKWLFRAKYRSVRPVGCPIASQQFQQIDFHPERGAHHPRAAREAVPPTGDVPEESQQQVGQQPGPDLPLDGALVGADEVAQLQGLLDLLEEQFDRPARPIEFGDGAGAPVGVVGDEGHLAFHTVDRDQRRDPPQHGRVAFRRLHPRRAHEFVLEDLSRARQFLYGFEEHPPLVAQDEEDAARVQVGKEVKIDVGAVGQQHVARHQVGAQRRGAHRIVVPGVLHDGERGQESADIQAHVALGGRLPAAVPSPVDAGQGELQGRGVHREDAALHSEDEPGVPAVRGKTRADFAQVIEHRPIQRLGHCRVARTVGVGERVPRRWRCPAGAHELGLMHAQRVAGLVQTVGVRQVRVEQREHMTVRTECSGVNLELTRQFGNQLFRNQVASLPESGMIASRWPGCRALAGAGRLAVPSTRVVFHAPVDYRRSATRSAFL